MKRQALLQLGAELMHQFRHGNGPADAIMGGYLRTRGFLGAKDRRFLADVYYAAFRHLRRYDEAIHSAFANTPLGSAATTAGFPVSDSEAAAIWHRKARTPERRQTFLDRTVDTARLGLAAVELDILETEAVAAELIRCWPRTKTRKDPPREETVLRMMTTAVEAARGFAHPRRSPDAERAFSFPSWLWTQLVDGLGPGEWREFGESLNGQSPVALRVNTLRGSVAEVEALLSEAGIEFTRGTLAPEAILLRARLPRNRLVGVREGLVEVQDEGSQLVSVYTSPEQGTTVVDACAGAGGKALHLAALMGNQGVVYTLDADVERLERTGPRAERAGVTIVDTGIRLGPDGAIPDDDRLRNVDAVLIDAPCSGTGTLRRNPELRWRLDASYLAELLPIQEQLLETWAPRVRPGGVLVYATCSLLRLENEDRVEAFLARHPDYAPETPPGPFPVELSSRGEMRLFPHRHGTDGFYAARLRRRAD